MHGKFQNRQKTIVLMLLIAMIVVSCSCFIFLFKVHRDSNQRYVDSLRSTHEQLSSALFEMEEQVYSIYYQLTLDSVLGEWLQQEKATTLNMYMLGNIQEDFMKYINTNNRIISFYLYNKTNQTVLSTNYEFTQIDNFPDQNIFRKNEVRAGHWIKARPEQVGFGEPRTILTYLAPIGNSGLLAINVDEEKLFPTIPASVGVRLYGDDGKLLRESNGGAFNFADDDQETLFAGLPVADKKPQTVGPNYVFVSKRSGGEWKVATAIKRIELSPEWKIRQGALVFLSLLVLASVAALYWYMRRIYLQPMVQFQARYNENLEDLKHNFMLGILTRKLREEDMRDKMKELDIRFTSDRFLVIVFQIDDYYSHLLSMKQEERFFRDKTIYNAIKWIFMTTYPCYAVKAEFEKIAILLSMPKEGNDEIFLPKVESTIQYLQREIRENCGLTVCAGLSGVEEGIGNVHSCYYQALQAVELKAIYGKDSIIRYMDVAERSTDVTTHQRTGFSDLSNLVCDGRLEEFSVQLDEAVQFILHEGRFSMDRINALFSNVLFDIIKITLELRYEMSEIIREDMFLKLYSVEFVQQKKEYVLYVVQSVAEYIQTRKNTSNKTVQLILEYVEANYDKTISLTSISDSLGINPSYISTLMKNELGCGFVDYLNQLRIKKALQLLENQNLPIKQISEACGYDTVHTFIRNFKKIHLFTPTEYRSRMLAKRNV